MTKKYVRVGFTAAQKTELWERWRSGAHMKSIGRELGKRSRLALSSAEREDISCGLIAGRSLRAPRRLCYYFFRIFLMVPEKFKQGRPLAVTMPRTNMREPPARMTSPRDSMSSPTTGPSINSQLKATVTP